MDHFIVFSVGNQEFGFDLATVERVVWAAEITPLPQASPYILGVLNLQGKIIPVLNMHKIFNLPIKELVPEDQFIICHFQNKTLALWVDHTKGVIYSNQKEISSSQDILPNTDLIEWVIKNDSHLTLIFNLEKIALLSDIYARHLVS